MDSKLNLISLAVVTTILILTACGAESAGASGDSAYDGKAIFTTRCVLCHGTDGRRAVNGAKDLTKSMMPLNERIALIRNGKNLMTPFSGILSDAEIEAVAKFSMTLK